MFLFVEALLYRTPRKLGNDAGPPTRNDCWGVLGADAENISRWSVKRVSGWFVCRVGMRSCYAYSTDRMSCPPENKPLLSEVAKEQ